MAHMTIHSRPLSVAVIGAGLWGQHLVRNFHALGVLGAICDADVARLRTLEERYAGTRTATSVEDILGDSTIDAVAIATPAEKHVVMARQAIQSGKDVFVEKPLALTLAEGQSVVDLARERGRVLMEAAGSPATEAYPRVVRRKETDD